MIERTEFTSTPEIENKLKEINNFIKDWEIWVKARKGDPSIDSYIIEGYKSKISPSSSRLPRLPYKRPKNIQEMLDYIESENIDITEIQGRLSKLEQEILQIHAQDTIDTVKIALNNHKNGTKERSLVSHPSHYLADAERALSEIEQTGVDVSTFIDELSPIKEEILEIRRKEFLDKGITPTF